MVDDLTMFNGLSQQRCFNHRQREAAAKCPECGRYFCRECITEHEDRVLCAQCLRNTKAPAASKFPILVGPVRIFQFFCGLALLWIVFYYLGDILLKLPSSFHEGTLWIGNWWMD